MRPPPQLIHQCAQLSLDIYPLEINGVRETEDQFQARFRTQYCHLGACVFIHERSTDTHCAIVYNSEWIYVVFRGTASWRVAILDGEAIPNLYGWHLGLYRMWMSVRGRVIDALRSVNVWGRIMFTGHSAGGANADAAWSEYWGSSCITFGEPRNTTRALAHKLRQLPAGYRIRVVNYLDIIPRVPTPPWFWHNGDLLQFGVHGGHHWNPGWHKRAWWFIKGVLWQFLLFWEILIVPDHARRAQAGEKGTAAKWHEYLFGCHHMENYVKWTRP